MSKIVFAPVNTSQKSLFNIKGLKTQFESFTDALSKAIIDLEEQPTQEMIKEMIEQHLASAYGTGNGKKVKKEGEDKKPWSAYLFFCQEHREELRKEFNDPKELTRQLGQMWRDATDEEKEPFVEQAAEAKAEYEKRNPSKDKKADSKKKEEEKKEKADSKKKEEKADSKKKEEKKEKADSKKKDEKKSKK
jgi:hypothetical protein